MNDTLNINVTFGGTNNKSGVFRIFENSKSKFINETQIKDNHFVSSIIIVYFTFLVCGVCLNLLHTSTLFRCRNGASSLIFQLSLVDSMSLYVSASEILAINRKTWLFKSEFCPFFRGSEILINSLTLYLVICFNFHVVSLWNLHNWNFGENNKNPLTSHIDDDSSECLTKPENSTRVVNIDYRKKNNDISVVFPTILIWFVSLSLSVPCFTLSSTLKVDQNQIICAIIDAYYGQILQYLLMTFTIIIPLLLLLLSLVLLVARLSKICKENIETVLTKKYNEIKLLLIFAITLTILYICTSFQRQVLHFLYIVNHSFKNSSIDNFKMPPLFNNYLNYTNIATYLAMLHYSGSLFRGLLYLKMLPMFKYLSIIKDFCCICGNKS